MQTTDIIAEIDAEISRLQQAKAILSGTTAKRGPGRTPTVPTSTTSVRRPLSSEARARIAAAQKARWAKTRKAAK
jgi:hypothetical protein